METKLSTELATHYIYYTEGAGSCKRVKVYEREATEALKQWKLWKPVPVPNKDDLDRSCMVLNPAKIDTIKRFRYVN